MDIDERRRGPAVAQWPETRTRLWLRRPRLVQVVAVAALAWGVAYLVWRIGWSGSGAPILPFLALLAAEVYGWTSLAFYAFSAWSVPPSPRPELPAVLPSVDVFVCTYDEPASVLEPTLIGCRAIKLPHTTFLLDDGRRPEMEALARRLGARYVTRPDNRHAKAGNINHALGVTSGELILFLDADHVPSPEILDATLGYFSDPALALVQTPHDFFNRDSVQHTRTARHEQTLFYEVIAPGKDRQNAMFWCGSATVVRRAALTEVGGVLTDTVAEDFHTTIAMHARGWRTRYHQETLVQGLAPHDLAGFLLQRARWARGNLAVFRTTENPITCRGLTIRQRLSYFASLSNYFSGLQRMALLLVLMWTLATAQLPMHASVPTLLLLWLPWSSLALLSTCALGRGALGAFDSTRYGIMTIGINLRGVLALFGARRAAFKVTPKEGVDEGGFQVLRSLGLVCGLAGVLAGVWIVRMAAIVGLVSVPDMPALAKVITVGLGAWEMTCIVLTVGPLVRRHQLRHEYRFPVTLGARVAPTSTVVPVLDLTARGLAFEMHLAMERGTTLVLLTRLPDSAGAVHDIRLPVLVSSCRRQENDTYRIGGRFVDLDPETSEVLVEYCHVTRQAQQFQTSRVAAPAATLEANTRVVAS